MAAPATLPGQAGERQDAALGPYLRALKAHKLLVALATLLAIGAAVAWTFHRSPEYKATARILVSPLPSDDSSFLGLQVVRETPGDPARTIQTAASLVDSPEAARLVAQEMGAGWTVRRVRDAVEIKPEGQSNILDVTATEDKAALAARLASSFARNALTARRTKLQGEASAVITRLREQQKGLTPNSQEAADLQSRLADLQPLAAGQDPTLSVSQLAVPPSSPGGAPAWLLAFIAAIAGFTIGITAALLMELLDRRVRDEDGLLALLPLPVLTRVPRMHGYGRRKLPLGPTSAPPVVREAYRTLAVQIDSSPNSPRTIMVTSGTNSDGKTTTAINLALALLSTGHRVLLIDLDLRKPDVGRLLGVSPKYPIASVVAGTQALSELVVPAPEAPTLGVVAAAPAGADVVALEAVNRDLPDLLREARQLADYVVLDTAPLGQVSDALRLATEADEVIIASRPGNTDRANIEFMRDLLDRSGVRPMGFVLVGMTSPVPSSYYYAYGYSGKTPDTVAS